MNTLWRITFSIGILFSQASLATPERPLCEGEMLPNVRKVMRILNLGIGTRDLDSSDLEFMISDSERLKNPYVRKPKGERNLSYRRSLDRDFQKMNSNEVAQIRAALESLIHKSAVQGFVTQKAQHETRLVFAPKEVSLNRRVETPREGSSAWVETARGTQFAYWNLTSQKLELLNPSTGESQPVPFEISDANEERKKLSVENGFALSWEDGRAETKLAIYNFQSGKSAVIQVSENKLEDFKIVHGPERRVYILARNKSAIVLYALEADLKLQEVRKYSLKNEEYVVETSEDGRILVVALSDLRTKVSIIEPLTQNPPRIFKPKWPIVQTRPYLGPNGRHAVAFTASGTFSDYAHLIVARSDTPEILESERFESPTTLVAWQTTQDGRSLLAVQSKSTSREGWGIGRGRSVTNHDILLYDIFHPNLELAPSTRFLDKFRKPRQIIKPSMPVIRSPHLSFFSSLYETLGGRLFVVFGESIFGHNNRVQVFEPAVSTHTPVLTFEVPVSNKIFSVTMHEHQESELPYFIVQVDGWRQIYAGAESPRLLMTLPRMELGPITRAADGNLYIVGHAFIPNSSPPADEIKLIRLTSSGGEQP